MARSWLEHFLLDVNRNCDEGFLRLKIRVLRRHGAEMCYLPAYSPDLNPIENAYAKIKSDLRKGAAGTVDALWRLVGRSVKAIAPSECAGHFRHAGYHA